MTREDDMRPLEKLENCPRCDKILKESEYDFQWCPCGWGVVYGTYREDFEKMKTIGEDGMKRKDFFFYYSDRYCHGSFDIREVAGWRSQDLMFRLSYIIHFKRNGMDVELTPIQFREFEKMFNELEDK